MTTRTRLGAALFGLLVLLAPRAVAKDAPPEPTPDQLKQAKDAFAKKGGTYYSYTESETKQTFHGFSLPDAADDAALKGLPNPPFPFGLSLSGTKVTDAGLKELKDLTSLTRLDLCRTVVTDAGLKEFTELKKLTILSGFRHLRVEQGKKELQKTLPKCEIER